VAVRLCAIDIEPAPKLGNSIDTRFIKGIAKQDDRHIILLDINEGGLLSSWTGILSKSQQFEKDGNHSFEVVDRQALLLHVTGNHFCFSPKGT